MRKVYYILGLLIGIQTSVASIPGPYTFADIGSGQANGLNDSGQVVGGSALHGYLYHGGNHIDLGPGEAYKINAVGQIIGSTGAASGGYVWNNGIATSLGSLGGGFTVPQGVNDAGHIVGRTRTNQNVVRAFRWINGVLTDLGSMGAGQESYATGINTSDQISGYANITASVSLIHAFRMENGVKVDLESLAGPSGWSYAWDINSTGLVVGASEYGAGSLRKAFLWSPANGMLDLGALGGQESQANGINGSGQIVGFARDAQQVFRGFVWSEGVMYDLNSLTALPPGWRITAANDISDNGWIAGSAVDSTGNTHAVLLTPEPSAASILLLLLALPHRRSY